MLDDVQNETRLEKVQRLQDGLISRATGGPFPGDEVAYQKLRRELLEDPEIGPMLPPYVRSYRMLGQFWQFIKQESGQWAERRVLIWDGFQPIIERLEREDRIPGVQPIGETLQAFDPDKVHAAWQKALDRRLTDPEGAITAARTLLESVCKHILDDANVDYADDGDLPKLWNLCAEQLNLAPHQHQERLFKTILGSCQSVVNSLGSLRNKIGDAHGVGRRGVKPKPRHAELAVNLAGAMAAFLVATWKDRSETGAADPPS